jgi:hypothetical protein
MEWYHALRIPVTSGLLLAAPVGCNLIDCRSGRAGNLDTYNPLVAPDTVTVNQPFTVTVTTSGSRYCTRPARVDVSINALLATLVPYDEERTCGGCDFAEWEYPRDVEPRFSITGQACVRLTGRDGTVERGVVVRP